MLCEADSPCRRQSPALWARHTHHQYNSDCMLDDSWRNMTPPSQATYLRFSHAKIQQHFYLRLAVNPSNNQLFFSKQLWCSCSVQCSCTELQNRRAQITQKVLLIYHFNFYVKKQLLLSACLSHRNSVRPSVRLSVCHTRITKSSPSLAWKTLDSGSVKPEINWQFVNRNCYRLSRISWALAQISCLLQSSAFAQLLQVRLYCIAIIHDMNNIKATVSKNQQLTWYMHSNKKKETYIRLVTHMLLDLCGNKTFHYAPHHVCEQFSCSHPPVNNRRTF